MSEANKALLRRYMEEVDRRKVAPEELLDQSFATHVAGFPSMDLSGYKELVSAFYAAFPDLNHSIEDLIAEGDTLACRATVRGTHHGELMGIAATGKEVTVSVNYFFRVDGGKVAEEWAVVDMMGLMQQIGAIPEPG